MSTMGEPAREAVEVTPSDASLIAQTRALYVGAAGTVKVTMQGGTDVTFAGVTAGTLLPVRCRKVFATGTSASSIVALY